MWESSRTQVVLEVMRKHHPHDRKWGPLYTFLFFLSRLSNSLTKDSMNIKAHIRMLLEVRAALPTPRLFISKCVQGGYLRKGESRDGKDHISL